MMDDLEFSLWCDEQKFSELARKVIKGIRSSEPVRSRQSRVGNWTGRYASDKMKRTVQFESKTDEFVAVVSYEHDGEVHEYYDQPSKIEMRYVAKSGGPAVFWHTPDFFLLRIDGAGWEEWKPQEKLVELAKSMPNRNQPERPRRLPWPPRHGE